MAIIKEFREFFLRSVQVNSGAKPDQETGFIISYFVNGVSKFNRFLKGHFPSKDVMTKFLESVTFKLNKEDRSQLTQQGLVVIATDTNTENRISNAVDGTVFTAGVVPHQLPEIVLSTDINDVVIGTPIELGGLKLSSLRRTLFGLFRKNYKIEVNIDKSIEIDNTTKKVQLVNDSTTPGNNYYYGTNNTGVKGFFSKLMFNLRNSTDWNNPFGLTISNNINVLGAVGIVPSSGLYYIIYEADIVIATSGINSIVYRLHKTSSIAINDDRIILVNVVPPAFSTQKIYCTAIAQLLVGEQVLLNVDSSLITNIAGRSITMIKINE